MRTLRDVLIAELRRAVEAHGLNEVGRASGVDPGVISRLLRGQRDIQLQSASKLATYLGVTARVARRRKSSGSGG